MPTSTADILTETVSMAEVFAIRQWIRCLILSISEVLYNTLLAYAAYNYSRRRIAPVIAEDCYILAVFYLLLFPTTDFSTSLGRFSRNFAARRGVF